MLDLKHPTAGRGFKGILMDGQLSMFFFFLSLFYLGLEKVGAHFVWPGGGQGREKGRKNDRVSPSSSLRGLWASRDLALALKL